ncbi:BAM_G0031030.mRNA.1.CDS.1 [Saccharomyces cerevisiae]|nr:BAM_G0031030.mRNA.1.CDS.1 [Saccharomyces cerevisiae]CAI7187492.1 BAM_G0031030.mRNA.1.CDS.1 [Saccharomyces cerevisiae]
MFAFYFLPACISLKGVLGVSPSYNGLGLTHRWDGTTGIRFACDVSEQLLRDTADRISDLGLKDMGYNMILDDCWSSGRDSDGFLVADEQNFPMLSFGMYSSAGEYTCAGYPGSLGWEEDAQFFANNRVDYLKYDNCYNKGQFGTPEISTTVTQAMSDALNKTGRPIFYSLCNWGQDLTFLLGLSVSGDSWRMRGDVTAEFTRPDSRCPCDGMNTIASTPVSIVLLEYS